MSIKYVYLSDFLLFTPKSPKGDFLQDAKEVPFRGFRGKL